MLTPKDISDKAQALLQPAQGAVTVILLLVIITAIWALFCGDPVKRTGVALWLVLP